VAEATPEGVLETVLERLDACWRLLSAADLAPLRREWAELDTTAGRRVRWSERGLTGTAEGVDAGGALLIRAPGGELVTAAVGEVGFLE
jgi:biotin-(acetyl-CoA carboxylase) ligase